MALFLFFGEDQWSLLAKLKFWQREFEKKYSGDMNVSVLEGKATGANEIFQTGSSMPFLAEKRLVMVKDFLRDAAAEEQTAAAEILEKIPDFCVLIFTESEAPDRRTSLYKKIHKIGTLMEFPALAGTKLLAWIEKTAFQAGSEIEKEAVIFLSELSDGDLFRLENEIKKLAAFASGRKITKADIELLMNTQLTASIFRLTDGIGQKNRGLVLQTLHNLIDSGEDLHRILYMIMRQFRIITCVKDLSESGARKDEITAKLKEHPFVISNTLNQVRNFSNAQIQRAYELLIEMDSRLKSGGIKILAGDNREFVLALDRLVLDLCK